MGLSYARVALVVLMSSTVLAVSSAFPSPRAGDQWPAFNQTALPPLGAMGRWPSFNHTAKGSRKIVVGGADKWRIGFNYTEWACKNGPFFQNDVLVFKYEAPTKAAPIAHSVYLLPTRKSFLNCDLKKAKVLANTKQGAGDGFEYTLKSCKKPYYFACGESKGIHCGPGLMKFAVFPFFKRLH
uniref:Phytocyanin domain-containing protein n=1 Tax=Kalanchoe fedtschenkoi TaxID=63787 RepID=A0A7N0T1B7_KALFE